MPLAVGECHVDGVNTAYVANAVSGFVTVLNVDELSLVTNIPVTLTPDGQAGKDLFHTLQVPIQTPVSPNEHWVATAVLSLTTVPTSVSGSADHVAIIDTSLNQVVAYVPTPAGTHGVNWGAKLGGGYYAYVTNQHANVLTVIDPDPNGDEDGSDAAVVGTILLANGSQGAGISDGVGGQGVKPLPLTHDGWVQRTVDMVGSGLLSPEVEGWVDLLTEDQKNPESHHDELNLTIDPLVAGAPATVSALGANEQQLVNFLLSLSGTGDGPCFAGLGGQCISLLSPFQILLTLPADSNGLASFTVTVPASAVGLTAHLQAVVVAGNASVLSNTVSHVVQ